MGKALVWILIAIGIMIAAYIFVPMLSAACYNPNAGPDMPNESKATHSFYIKNTGGLVLSSDFEQHGQEVGSRVFILNGFWEVRGNKFKFVPGVIIIDEGIFGEITVKRR
jgi:hypothetical protein